MARLELGVGVKVGASQRSPSDLIELAACLDHLLLHVLPRRVGDPREHAIVASVDHVVSAEDVEVFELRLRRVWVVGVGSWRLGGCLVLEWWLSGWLVGWGLGLCAGTRGMVGGRAGGRMGGLSSVARRWVRKLQRKPGQPGGIAARRFEWAACGAASTAAAPAPRGGRPPPPRTRLASGGAASARPSAQAARRGRRGRPARRSPDRRGGSRGGRRYSSPTGAPCRRHWWSCGSDRGSHPRAAVAVLCAEGRGWAR